MKKIIEDTSPEGMLKLIGETITVFCVNYFYTGRLTGVNDVEIMLTEPQLVYETGSFVEKNWQDAQKLPTHELYIKVAAIESYGIFDKC